MKFEKTTSPFKTIKYTFNFEGYNGVCYIEVEPGEFSTSNTIIAFPEGKYSQIAKVSNNMLNDDEAEAINALAEICRDRYKKALSKTNSLPPAP